MYSVPQYRPAVLHVSHSPRPESAATLVSSSIKVVTWWEALRLYDMGLNVSPQPYEKKQVFHGSQSSSIGYAGEILPKCLQGTAT
jgi:hypothetical protein